jgi:hypothetical protein
MKRGENFLFLLLKGYEEIISLFLFLFFAFEFCIDELRKKEEEL